MIQTEIFVKNGKNTKRFDLSDTAGDLNLVDHPLHDEIDIMNIRKEKLNVIISAGPGDPQRIKVGYNMYYSNGNKHPITAYMNTNLGTVNRYVERTTE